MCGWSRRSEILARTFAAKPKIFSEYAISRLRIEHDLLLFGVLEAFPFELGDLFDELLHVVVIAHRLTDSVFPQLGDRKLSRLPPLALDQIEGSMELAPSAAAIRFAAGAAADGEGSAKEAGVMDELSEPAAEVALGAGEAGPVHEVTLPSEILIIYQTRAGCKAEHAMRICPDGSGRPNHD
jgi:hypothetical protein